MSISSNMTKDKTQAHLRPRTRLRGARVLTETMQAPPPVSRPEDVAAALPRNDTFSLLCAEEGGASTGTVAGTGSGALPTLTVIGHGVGQPSLPSLAAARLEEVYAAAIAYASTAQQLAQPPPCETVLPVFVPESFYAWREDAALASTDTALASV